MTWTAPLSDPSNPLPSPSLHSKVTSTLDRLPQLDSKKGRMFRTLPVTEPFKLVPREQSGSFHNSARLGTNAYVAVMKAWPNSDLASPKHRMPQTSMIVWEEKRKAVSLKDQSEVQTWLPSEIQFHGNQSESRQTQLSEFKWSSPYEEGLVTAHMQDIDQHEDELKETTTHCSLPDKSVVVVTQRLDRLLKTLLEHRMIQNVVKFMYSEGAGMPAFTGVFQHVFSFNRRKPILKLEQCPIETTTLILSSHDSLTINKEKAGFDPVHNAIINIERLDPRAGSVLPLSTLVQKSENLVKSTKKVNPLTQSLNWKKPLMVPTSILSTVDLPPFLEGELIRKTIRDTVQSKVNINPPRQSLTLSERFNPSLSTPAQPKSLRSKGLLTKDLSYSSRPSMEAPGMLVSSKPPTSPYVPGVGLKNSLPMSLGRLTEGNAGFRRKPEPTARKPRSPVRETGGWTHVKKSASVDTAIKTLKTDAKMKKSLMRLSDQVMRQLDVEAFCARYSLTVPEFAKLLEEFSILSLTGYDRPPASIPEGVHVPVLCDFYKVSIEALRGIKPELFDYPVSDQLDVMRVIPPSVVVTWMDFVVFYSLAVRQRAQLADLVPFLLRFARVGKRSQLDTEVLYEAMKGRFHPVTGFTETLQRIWGKVTACLVEEQETMCDMNGLIDVEAATDAIERSQVSVLDLRYLVAEIFREGRSGY